MVKIHKYQPALANFNNNIITIKREIKTEANKLVNSNPNYTFLKPFVEKYIDNDFIYDMQLTDFIPCIEDWNKCLCEIALGRKITVSSCLDIYEVFYNVLKKEINQLIIDFQSINKPNGSPNTVFQSKGKTIQQHIINKNYKELFEDIGNRKKFSSRYFSSLTDINLYYSNFIQQDITSKFKKIFDYDSLKNCFYKELFQDLGISVCVYCNRNHINVGQTLDHFYPKKSYPYLAFSFFNLLPSCGVCNGTSLKGQKPTCLSTHLNPYEYGFEGIASFDVDVQDIQELIGFNNRDFKIVFKYSSLATKKAKENISLFKLESQYEVHTIDVRRILNICEEYPKLQAPYKTGVAPFEQQENIDKEIIKMLLNVVEEEEFNTRSLSKLSRDIVKKYYPKLLE